MCDSSAGDDDGGEDEDEKEDTMTAEQFLEAAKTTPQLLRYFASIGLLARFVEFLTRASGFAP